MPNNLIFFLGLALAVIGLAGLILVRKNTLVMIFCIELMLLGINLGFIYTSLVYYDLSYQILVILILTVAAAESSIGLALLLVYYRMRKVISLNYISLLKA